MKSSLARQTPPGRRRLPSRASGHQVVDAIVSAAEQLVVEHGRSHLTVARLAVRSGVCVGSIYQYFESVDGVIAESARRLEKRALAMSTARLTETQTKSLSSVAACFVDTLLSPDLLAPRMRRTIGHAVPAQWTADTQARVDAAVEQEVMRLLDSPDIEVRDGDRQMMAFIVVRAIEAVVEGAVSRRPELLENRCFREELLRLALAYLQPTAQSC